MKPLHSGGDDDSDEVAKGAVSAPALIPAKAPDITNRRLGTVLRGKYRLEAVLGVGGMAIVYRAIHRNQAEYAIKMLLPEHAANEELRSRFLREGYAANSVKHPGAVRVVDDDVSEDGTAFLVLELLHGISCDKLCSAHGGRLSIEAACAIGLQALDVLHSAHLNGIIHRDVKPANLFLLRSGDIKVLDFGIARVRETLATGSYSTGSGVLLGTPAFMAPEQAFGKASDVDARADIWATGATLFAMMSGLTVHEGDSGRELIVKLVTRPTRSLLAVMPEAPRALADVVDRALAVERENRWPSAAAMRDGLADASRQLWKERSALAVLASLGESIAPDPPSSAQATSDSEEQRRSPAPPAAPTLRAQESPVQSEPATKQSVETARAVSREGSPSRPRRRVSPFVILAMLGLGAGIAAIAAVTARGRDGSAQPFSSAAGGAAAILSAATAPQGVVSAVGSPAVVVVPVPATGPSPPAGSDGARPLDAVPPSVGGRPVRPRGAPRPGRAAPPASAAPSPNAQTPSSSPAAASPSVQPSTVASERPATPPNCTPPYYYDSKMNRVFKKECL